MSHFLYVPCPECVKKNGFKANFVQYKLLNDTGILEFYCSEGHKNNVIVQNFDFEILFGMALESMCDEYYRDAVFNFASALERCREFAIELICYEKKISVEDYKKFWKIMTNQSERQLGAFVALFLLRFGVTYKTSDEMTRIRNGVIHKGSFVSLDDAKNYGDYVLDEIQKIIGVLVLNIDKKTFLDFTLQKLKEKKVTTGTGICTTINLGIFSFRTATDKELEIESKLKEYSKAHSEEYSKMVQKANASGKILSIDNSGALVLKNAEDIFLRQEDEKYVNAYKNLGEAIESYRFKKQHYEMAERGNVELLEIRRLKGIG